MRSRIVLILLVGLYVCSFFFRGEDLEADLEDRVEELRQRKLARDDRGDAIERREPVPRFVAGPLLLALIVDQL